MLQTLTKSLLIILGVVSFGLADVSGPAGKYVRDSSTTTTFQGFNVGFATITTRNNVFPFTIKDGDSQNKLQVKVTELPKNGGVGAQTVDTFIENLPILSSGEFGGFIIRSSSYQATYTGSGISAGPGIGFTAEPGSGGNVAILTRTDGSVAATFRDKDLTMGYEGKIRFQDNIGQYVTLRSTAEAVTDVALVLPPDYPSSEGQALLGKTNGDLYFGTVSGGSGGGSEIFPATSTPTFPYGLNASTAVIDDTLVVGYDDPSIGHVKLETPGGAPYLTFNSDAGPADGGFLWQVVGSIKASFSIDNNGFSISNSTGGALVSDRIRVYNESVIPGGILLNQDAQGFLITPASFTFRGPNQSAANNPVLNWSTNNQLTISNARLFVSSDITISPDRDVVTDSFNVLQFGSDPTSGYLGNPLRLYWDSSTGLHFDSGSFGSGPDLTLYSALFSPYIKSTGLATAALPGFSFSFDSGNGMYMSSADDTLRFSAGAEQIYNINTASMTILAGNNLVMSTGSVLYGREAVFTGSVTANNSIFLMKNSAGVDITSATTTGNWFITSDIKVGTGTVNNSVDNQILISRNVDNRTTGNGHGFSDSSNITRTGTIGYNSYDGRIEVGVTMDHYAAFQSLPDFNSGTITNYYGLYAGSNHPGGTITNWYGVYTGASVIGAGTIGISNGVYIATPGEIPTTDYGLRIATRSAASSTHDIWLESDSARISYGTSRDLILTRDSAFTLQLWIDAASPSTTTLQGTGASGTNINSAALNINGGQGTGTGAGGAVNLRIAPIGASGGAQNAYVTALSVSSTTRVQIAVSSSTGLIGRVGGTVYDNVTSSNNLTTVETDLSTQVIPGNFLAVNKDAIHFIYSGTIQTSINNKTLKVYFGGTTIFDSTAQNPVAATEFIIEGWIFRTGAATQKSIVKLNTTAGNLFAFCDYATSAETLSGNVNLRLTGTGGASNEITFEAGKIYFEPSSN